MSHEATFKILADLVFALHMGIVVVLFGGVIGNATGFFKKHRTLARFNLAVVAVTILSQIIFLGCPLTTLEQSLRAQYDSTTSYFGSFVVYYLLKYTGIQVPSILVTTTTWLIVVITIVALFTWGKPNKQPAES